MSEPAEGEEKRIPDDVAWRLQQADGYIDLRMYARARETLEEIPANFQDETVYKLVKLRLAMSEEDWDKAMMLATDMKSMMPKNPGFWIQLAYATRRAKSMEAAREILLDAIKLFPKEATIPYNLACYECQLGNMDKALALLETAYGIEPKYHEAAFEDSDLEPLWDRLTP